LRVGAEDELYIGCVNVFNTKSFSVDYHGLLLVMVDFKGGMQFNI
jgi:hypothetical protein